MRNPEKNCARYKSLNLVFQLSFTVNVIFDYSQSLENHRSPFMQFDIYIKDYVHTMPFPNVFTTA